MLIITGSIAWDYIMDFPGSFSDHIAPDQLHNINLSFIVRTFAKRRGGTAGNVSYTLGLLQTAHTLLSTAGQDFEEYRKVFTDLGINTSSVKIYNNTYTATGFGMTDRVDNQIWGFFYGANEYVEELSLKPFATNIDFVLIGPQGARGSMHFVKECIDLDLPYMFDPGFILTQVTDDELKYGIANARYLVGNDYEISMMKKRVPTFDEITKDKTIITTLGEKGAIINDKGNEITVKPAKVKIVIDPSGAGDAWRSGFLAGLQRSFDLQTCGEMGALAAAFVVEHYGPQEHLFTKEEFAKRYKETYNKDLTL